MGLPKHASAAVAGFLLIGVLGACSQTFHDDLVDENRRSSLDGPGHPAWGSDDLHCESSLDCMPSEDCVKGTCIIRLCANGPYESVAPLGPSHYFLHDRELLAGGDVVSAHQPRGGTTIRGQSTSQDGDKLHFPWRVDGAILDIAGGNVVGDRPERAVAIVAGQPKLYIQGMEPMELPFAPVAIAAGDVDHDGIDEVAGIAQDGSTFLCEVDEDKCSTQKFNKGAVGIDVGLGDVDGDNYDEPVFLFGRGEQTEMMVWNPDFKEHHQDEIYTVKNERPYHSLSVGDIDGDNQAEVLVLSQGTWNDAWRDVQLPRFTLKGVQVAADRLEIMQVSPKYEPPTDATRLNPRTPRDERGEPRTQRLPYLNTTTGSHVFGELPIDPRTIDVVVSDLDMDRSAEVILLRENGEYQIYRATGIGKLAIKSGFEGVLAGAQNARRIYVADVDGDSPKARLIDPIPKLVAGKMIPLMQIHWPPYSRTFSATTPYVYVGHTEGTGHHNLDSVGFYAGTELGLGYTANGFGASVAARIKEEIRTYHRVSYDQFIGSRLVQTPDIDLHGHDYSVVLLANACYHVYQYRLWDPQRRLGDEVGEEMTIALPVDGYVTSWSSKRYNAIAKVVGNLPLVGGTFEIGNLEAYPNTPLRPDGRPILPSEEVFDRTPRFWASDTARIGWWLSAKEYDVREAQRFIDVQNEMMLAVPFVRWFASKGSGGGVGSGVSMSQEVLFGGAIPPIADDPKTPEDEFRAHKYSLKPIVYREPYGNPEDGTASSYYVLSFTVGK